MNSTTEESLLNSVVDKKTKNSIVWSVLINYINDSFRLRLKDTRKFSIHVPSFSNEFLHQAWDQSKKMKSVIKNVVSLTAFVRPVRLSGYNQNSVLLYQANCSHQENISNLLYTIGATSSPLEISSSQSNSYLSVINCQDKKEVNLIAYQIPLLQTRYSKSFPVLFDQGELTDQEWKEKTSKICLYAARKKYGAQIKKRHLVIWKPLLKYSYDDEIAELENGVQFNFQNWNISSLSTKISRIGLLCGRIGNIPAGELFVAKLLSGQLSGKKTALMSIHDKLTLLNPHLSSSESSIIYLNIENYLQDQVNFIAKLVMQYSIESLDQINNNNGLRSAMVYASKHSGKNSPWLNDMEDKRDGVMVGYVSKNGSPSFYDVDQLIHYFGKGDYRIPDKDEELFEKEFISDIIDMDLNKLYARSVGANCVSPKKHAIEEHSKEWYKPDSSVSKFVCNILGKLQELDKEVNKKSNTVCVNKEVEVNIKGEWKKGIVVETWDGKCIVDVPESGRHTLSLDSIRDAKKDNEDSPAIEESEEEHKPENDKMQSMVRGALPPDPPPLQLPDLNNIKELPPIFVLDDVENNSCVACRTKSDINSKYIQTVYDTGADSQIVSLCVECLGKIEEFSRKDPRT